MDWLLVLGLEEGLVECATLSVKSWVILQRKVQNNGGTTTNWLSISASVFFYSTSIKSGGVERCMAPFLPAPLLCNEIRHVIESI